MSENCSAYRPFLRKKSKGGIHSLLQGKIKPSFVARHPKVPLQLEKFCLKYPSLDKKICNQLDNQSIMKFIKTSRYMVEIKTKTRFFWVRHLQYQLGHYMGNRESDYGVMTNFRVEGVVYGRQVEGK